MYVSVLVCVYAAVVSGCSTPVTRDGTQTKTNEDTGPDSRPESLAATVPLVRENSG